MGGRRGRMGGRVARSASACINNYVVSSHIEDTRRTGEHDEHDEHDDRENVLRTRGGEAHLEARLACGGGPGGSGGANGAAGLGPESGATAPAWLAWIAASAVA